MSDKNYDVVILGAYTKDTIISPAGTRHVDGGGFNYGVQMVKSMGLKVAAITRLAQEDFHLVEELQGLGIDVYATATPHSTCMTLEYPTTDVDQRTLYTTATSGSFTPDEVRGFSSRAFLVSPSIRGEVPLEVIKEIKKNNPFVSIDVQGFTRILGEDTILRDAPWPERDVVLGQADVVKTDAVEAKFLTGESDIRKAAKILHDLGPKEIVLTHRDGLLVYDGSTYYEAGFYPEKMVGRSGRGDTVTAAYMAKRLSAAPAAATIWAAAAVSIKMEQEGPFRRLIHEVEELIQRKYHQT